jgi:lipase maturation factor
MSQKPRIYWQHLQSDYVVVSELFLRGLAVIYLAAFASMAVQIEGLIGKQGILPIVELLTQFKAYYPATNIWQLPSVFWLNASDDMLLAACYAGMVAACLLLVNRYRRFAIISCYILYLSIVTAGQRFTQFQWDALLLESGFLAIFLSWGSGIVVLMYRWLIARFMLMGGIVKLASGDPYWASLTALNFHYETQPLPSPLAYYAHQLPGWLHKATVGGVFFIELVVPFFVFLPRKFRLFACASFVILQTSIILTGNYNFFNLLTILLCLFLLDDRDLQKMMLIRLNLRTKNINGKTADVFAAGWALVVLLTCFSHIWLYHSTKPLFEPLKKMVVTTSRFSLVNNYGPFAVMTTTRNEIIIQGSNDGVNWLDYEFHYKPGKSDQGLSWNIPHQPRLDWQMWFAALDHSGQRKWFDRFITRLLQGSPSVLSLLAVNPFPDSSPRFIRAMQYRYQFTEWFERKLTRQIWRRDNAQLYWPPKTLYSSNSN